MSVAHDSHDVSPQRLPEENAADVIIGKNVKNRRMICGLSQTDLANHLGVTYQQVQKFEHGKNRIGSGRLFRISGVLDCGVSVLFQGLESTADAGTIDPARKKLMEYHQSSQGLSLSLALSRIEDQVIRKRIVSLAHGIADSSSSED